MYYRLIVVHYKWIVVSAAAGRPHRHVDAVSVALPDPTYFFFYPPDLGLYCEDDIYHHYPATVCLHQVALLSFSCCKHHYLYMLLSV